MIVFRQNGVGYPFLWERKDQAPARWHGKDEGPVQYFSDTADGAWAEFLRHQDIVDPTDLEGISRDIWAVEIPAGEKLSSCGLNEDVCTGGKSTYTVCRKAARTLRARGVSGIKVPSAALLHGAAGGWKVDGGIVAASRRNGKSIVLFGRRSKLRGWKVAASARPSAEILNKVRYF